MKRNSGIAQICCFLCSFLPNWGLGQPYVPGNTYFSDGNYIEYQAGNLPVIIAVPHGGDLEPAGIPNRNCSGCTYVKDSYTQEMSREIREAFFAATGCYPHIVINRLHRRKLDANREIAEAADGNAHAEDAWTAFHTFIDSSKNQVLRQYARGLFLDLHGHAHDIQRVELGYLLTGEELNRSDDVLNIDAYITRSSIKSLAISNQGRSTHAELLRGEQSIGALLENRSFPSVPSDSDPYPLVNQPYFNGGYNVARHGSNPGGQIDGVQVECNWDIRFDGLTRKRFAKSLAEVLLEYLEVHYFPGFQDKFCQYTSSGQMPGVLPAMVYPNPSAGILNLRTDLPPLSVRLYRSNGQLIRQFPVRPDQNWLDFNDLIPGAYFLQLVYKNSVETIRWIKN